MDRWKEWKPTIGYWVIGVFTESLHVGVRDFGMISINFKCDSSVRQKYII